MGELMTGIACGRALKKLAGMAPPPCGSGATQCR